MTVWFGLLQLHGSTAHILGRREKRAEEITGRQKNKKQQQKIATNKKNKTSPPQKNTKIHMVITVCSDIVLYPLQPKRMEICRK